MGYIYLITNTINGYNYVGQTTQTLNERLKEHIKSSNNPKDNNYFHNSIHKYGKENFIINLIKEVDDSLLNEEEIKEIEYRKSIGQAQYNIAGGGYNSPFKYKSEEERHQIAMKTVNTKNSKSDKEKEEFKIKFSKLMSGEGNGMYGKHHSDETKNKLKESYTEERLELYRQNNLGKNNPAAKKVIIYFEDGTTKIFDTRKECSEYLGYKDSYLVFDKKIKTKNNCIVKYI